MIKPNQLTALAITSVVSLLAAGALFAATTRWSAGKIEGARLLPGLERQEQAIAAVEVIQGEKRITLERAGAQWRIKERNGYPANGERVRTLLNTLVQAQLVEAKTAAKDKHHLLELEDPAAKDAKSRGIRILDSKGKALGEIVLGKTRYEAFGAGKGGVYVRRLGEAQTWLATGEPRAGLEVRDWVTTSIFEQDQAKILKVTVEHPGEAPYTVEKGDGKDQKYKIGSIPDGKKLKQNVAIDQVATGFGSIDLEDVRKLDAPPAGDAVSVLKLETEGGPTVTFRLRKDGDAYWLSLQAAGAEGEAKTRADAINAAAAGWEFKVPQWKVDQIGKRASDLFEAS